MAAPTENQVTVYDSNGRPQPSSNLNMKNIQCVNQKVTGGIIYDAAKDASNEGASVVIGRGGALTLKNTPNVDTTWSGTNNATVTVTSTSTELLTLTLDEDVSAAEGSWAVTIRAIDNALLGSSTLTLEMKEDTVTVYTKDILMGGGNQDLVFSHLFSTASSSGTVISINVSTDGDIDINPDADFVSELLVTKAAIPVTEAALLNLLQQTNSAYNQLAKFKDGKAITADYTVNPDTDWVLVCAATANNIDITLPLKSSLNGRPTQELMLTAIAANGYRVRVKCQGADTFHTGATYYDIPTASRNYTCHMHEHGFHQISMLSLHSMFALSSSWSSSNFSSLTTIPFDTTIKNDQAEIFVNASGVVTVLAAGDYYFSSNLSINSTGGSTWNLFAEIYVNGAAVPYSKSITGNYGNEDSGLQNAFHLELAAGDTVELKLDHTNLTGEVVEANMLIVLSI